MGLHGRKEEGGTRQLPPPPVKGRQPGGGRVQRRTGFCGGGAPRRIARKNQSLWQCEQPNAKQVPFPVQSTRISADWTQKMLVNRNHPIRLGGTETPANAFAAQWDLGVSSSGFPGFRVLSFGPIPESEK